MVKKLQYLCSGSPRAIVVSCLAFFFLRFSLVLLEVPRVRLVEQALCERFYRKDQNVHFLTKIPERDCKTRAIQTELATITGIRLSLDAVPGVLIAGAVGVFADRHGRKPTLKLIVLGESLAFLWTPLICVLNKWLPPELTWTSSVFLFIGGGDKLFGSLLTTIISDNIPYEKRTKFLYVLALSESLGGISAPPIAAWALTYSPLFPFGLATILSLLTIMVINLFSETRSFSTNADTVASLSQSGQHLISPPRDTDNVEHTDDLTVTETHEETGCRHSNELTAQNAYKADHGRQPWKEMLQLLLNPNLSILLGCFLAKRVAFGSEKFFSQYASEKFHLDLRQTPWFSWTQSLSGFMTLGLILPALTALLRRKNYSARLVDFLAIISSFSMLTIGFFLAWSAATPLAFGAALFVCGFGEGAAPSLQGLASSFVEPFLYARLFASIAAADTLGRIVSGPIMAALQSAGYHGSQQPSGLLFLLSSCIFAFALLLSFFTSLT